MGDGWVTQRRFGLFGMMSEYVAFGCLHPDGQIFNVTTLAECQGMLSERMMSQPGHEPDACRVWLTFPRNPSPQRDRHQQRQQEREARQQDRQARHEQSVRDRGNRKQGRKGRKRR